MRVDLPRIHDDVPTLFVGDPAVVWCQEQPVLNLPRCYIAGFPLKPAGGGILHGLCDDSCWKTRVNGNTAL